MVRGLFNFARHTALDHAVGSAAFIGTGAAIGGLNGMFNQVDNEWNSRGYQIFEGAMKGAGIGAALSVAGLPARVVRSKKYIQRDFGIDPSGRPMANVFADMNDAFMKEKGSNVLKARQAGTILGAGGYLVAGMTRDAAKSGIESFAPSLTKKGRAAKRAAKSEMMGSVNAATRREIESETGGLAYKAGLFGFTAAASAYTGFAISGFSGEEGHPYNAARLAMGGDRGRKGLAAYQDAYEGSAIVSTAPFQAGLRDTDEQYYSSSMRGSVAPISQGQRRRFTPGQYGDSGNLVLSLNQLRRA